MSGKFTVKPVKDYKAGYPKKGFFRRSFVAVVPLKFFSFFIIGLLFFITVPGCGEQELSGDAVPDYDISDTENNDIDDTVYDADTVPENDKEASDLDQIDGGAVPECIEDKDCDEGYFCDTETNTCVMELAGEAIPECTIDEDCAEGFYCDTETYTCVEEMLGDAVPDQMVDEDSVSDTDETPDLDEVDLEEYPDEELGGVAPPELKR